MNEYEKALTPSNELSDRHLKELLKSGLDSEIINQAGIKSSLNNDAIVFPIWDIHKKNIKGYRPRYNNEVIETNKYPSSEGKTPKYRQSNNLGNVFYFPPIKNINWTEIAEDINVPVFITEGEKKALKLIQEGYYCIGLFGVNNWVSKKKKDTKENNNVEEKSKPIEDFDLIKWKGRTVYLTLDSDKFKNKAVLYAEGSLWNYLKNVLGADVRVINLPNDPDAKGVDDFFVKHGENAKKKFEELIEKATPVSLGYLMKCKKQEMPHYLAQFICKTESILSTNTGLLIYEEGFYKTLLRDEKIKSIVMDYLQIAGVVPTPHLLTETVKMIETVSFNSHENINPKNMHNVANGTLVINPINGEVNLVPHSEKNILTYKADVEYSSSENTKEATNFLDNVIPDKDQQKIILEALGFALFPILRQHFEFTKMTLLYGEGSNGKTILTNFCERLVGTEACSSVSLDQLIKSDNRFIFIALYGKKANFSTESETNLIRESSVLKAITSGNQSDALMIEQKHKPAFKALVNPILMLALNRPITLPASRTFALERRVQMVNFPNTFSKNPKKGEVKANDKLNNPDFTRPLVNELILLVIKATQGMIARGYIWQVGVVENLKEAILKGSHFERFLANNIEIDIDSEIVTKELYETYKKHCVSEGILEEVEGKKKAVWHEDTSDKVFKTLENFSKQLKLKFKKQITPIQLTLSNKERARGYRGIKLIQQKPEDVPCIRAEEYKDIREDIKPINKTGSEHSCTDESVDSFEENIKPEFLQELKRTNATKQL